MSRTRSLLAALAGAVALTAAACAPQPDAPVASATTASSSAGPAAASSPTGADCSPDSPALHRKGQLTVATDSPAYEPWFADNKPANGQGFESAVAYAVAARLGFDRDQVKWTVEPFDNSYAPGPKNFDFDINQISVTPQRAKAVDFSTSYYTAGQGVLVLDGSRYAKAGSLAALKDARIGVQVATTSYQAVLDRIAPTHRPSIFNTTNDEIRALQNGQIDALVTDLPTVFYLASAELQRGRILGQFDYGGGAPEEFGLLLPKGSGLTTCLDQALETLKTDGTLKQLTDRWLSASANVPRLGQ